jgi:hypothetical protein
MKKIDGLLVTNAVRPVRLTVTASDIKNGAPKNPNGCAVALACVRQIPGATAAKVHLGRVYILIKGKWQRWATPEYATRELVAFDRGGRFVPGEYDLLPVPVLLSKAARQRQRLRRPSRKRRPIHHTEDVREEARKNEPASE